MACNAKIVQIIFVLSLLFIQLLNVKADSLAILSPNNMSSVTSGSNVDIKIKISFNGIASMQYVNVRTLSADGKTVIDDSISNVTNDEWSESPIFDVEWPVDPSLYDPGTNYIIEADGDAAYREPTDPTFRHITIVAQVEVSVVGPGSGSKRNIRRRHRRRAYAA